VLIIEIISILIEIYRAIPRPGFLMGEIDQFVQKETSNNNAGLAGCSAPKQAVLPSGGAFWCPGLSILT
jgi:hypothetical protein